MTEYKKPSFDRDDVEIVADDTAYQGFFQIRTLQLRHKLFLGGWSNTIRRELFVRDDAVGVLLFDPVLDTVALIEQFRIGLYGSDIAAKQNRSSWSLELVAGLIDKDESPEQVGSRESEEEAGARVEALEPIAEYYSSPGGSNEYFYLYAGKADLSNVEGVYGVAEESEDIRVHCLPLATLWQMLDAGEFSNAHTLIAVQWLQRHHQRLKQQWA